MTFFRRRRGRLDLGHYRAPVAAPPVPVERVVDEGLLVAISGIRMAVKNRMIVAALRDGLRYIDADHAAFAAARIDELAAHEEAAAATLRRRLDTDDLPDDDGVDQRVVYGRREEIRLGLADALRAVAADEGALAVILDDARYAALDDIAANLEPRSGAEPAASAHYTAGPDYAEGRSDRVAALVVLDLAQLAIEHGTSLEQLTESEAVGDEVS